VSRGVCTAGPRQHAATKDVRRYLKTAAGQAKGGLSIILDIRYHIASLVAVFLALGLGILIGASLLDEGKLIESQEKLISGLEKRFDMLQSEQALLERENAVLTSQINEHKAVLAALEQPLIEGALAGRRISVVYVDDGWRENWQEPLRQLLEKTGAVVVSSRLLSGLVGEDLTLKPDSQGMLPHGQGLSFNLQALAGGTGLLGDEMEQVSHNLVDIVLLVGSGGEHTAEWEKQLAAQVKDAGMGIAVIGTAEMQNHLHELARIGALALDNLNDAVGRIALVMGLSKQKSGYYGVGRHAKPPWTLVGGGEDGR